MRFILLGPSSPDLFAGMPRNVFFPLQLMFYTNQSGFLSQLLSSDQYQNTVEKNERVQQTLQWN